jgi:hypothetical protein
MNRVHWGRAIGAAALAEVSVIAASILWVAIYSYIINPGQPVATYNTYAQASAPWVSIVAGIPVFYLISRYIARSLPTAIALFAIILVVDAAILVGSTPLSQLPFGPMALSYLTKSVASYFGGHLAARHIRNASETRMRETQHGSELDHESVVI